jgi:hypothetical protein
MTDIPGEGRRRRFEEVGYLAPFRFLAAHLAEGHRRRIEALAAAHPADIGRFNYGRHPWMPWVAELHADFLDALEDLLGPDILFASAGYRIKAPNTGTYAGWHQDEFTLRYEPPGVTCLLAFGPCTRANGCLEVIPGSHKLGLLPHATDSGPDNYLSKAQRITVPIDATKAVAVDLEPGQAMIFDQRTIHGSGPNRSGDPRIACFADFCPPCSRRGDGKRVPAVLVRGVDGYGNFVLQ